MPYLRVFPLFLFVLTVVIGCGGGGGGGSPGPSGGSPNPLNLTLSKSAAEAGDLLLISHPQITAGSELTVSFEDADAADSGYALTAKTALTFSGSAMIAVPPYVDPQSAAVMSGNVTVRIDGIAASAALTINEPAEILDMAPGEATRMVVEFAIAEHFAALDKIDALPVAEQAPYADWIDGAENLITSLVDMSDELATGRLTVSDGANTVILEGAPLAMLDRLLVAQFYGMVDAATVLTARAVNMPPFMTTPRDLRTREGFADILRRVKTVGIPGVQAASSSITVGVGVVSLVAALVPGGQPLAVAGAAVAMFTTLISTAGAATAGFFTDLSIDAIEGRDPDVYRAADGAQVVLRDGFVSIALTATGGVNWAGSTLAGIASVVNDAIAGRIGLRDLKCALSSQSALVKATLTEFCTLTLASGPAAPSSFSADITIPGFSLSFDPSISAAIPSVWFRPQSTVAVVAAEGSDINSAYMLITLNPNVLSGPGTFNVSNDLTSSAALIVYATPEIKHAAPGLPIDGTSAALSSFAGTITIDTLGQSIGETIAGSFSVQIAGNQVTGVDARDNPISVQHTGTASGSFSVTIEATSPVALE